MDTGSEVTGYDLEPSSYPISILSTRLGVTGRRGLVCWSPEETESSAGALNLAEVPDFSSNGKDTVFRAPVDVNHHPISPPFPPCRSPWALHLPRSPSTTSKKSKNTAITPVWIFSIPSLLFVSWENCRNWKKIKLGVMSQPRFFFFFFLPVVVLGMKRVTRVSELVVFVFCCTNSFAARDCFSVSEVLPTRSEWWWLHRCGWVLVRTWVRCQSSLSGSNSWASPPPLSLLFFLQVLMQYIYIFWIGSGISEIIEDAWWIEF